jgi:hypothetical protein
MVREKIRSGELPRACDHVWAGAGTDMECSGCRVPTRVTGMEFECITGGATIAVMCKPCFFVWLQEAES